MRAQTIVGNADVSSTAVSMYPATNGATAQTLQAVRHYIARAKLRARYRLTAPTGEALVPGVRRSKYLLCPPLQRQSRATSPGWLKRVRKYLRSLVDWRPFPRRTPRRVTSHPARCTRSSPRRCTESSAFMERRRREKLLCSRPRSGA